MELEGTALSTGKFVEFAAEDDSAAYGGAEPGPAFPGEDFLENAPAGLNFPTDLAGASVMVTLEPVPDDNTEKPFFLKILLGDIPLDAVDHTAYELSKNPAPLPSGTATLK